MIFRLSPAIKLIAIFGVCSVIPTFAYPVSKANNWNNDESPNPPPSVATKQIRPSVAEKPAPRHADVNPLSPGTHNIALGVGQIFLTSDFSNFVDNAIGTQFQYTYGVSDLFSFESNFGYSSHSNAASTNKVSLLHLISGLRTNLIYFDQLIPFFSGGLGFYRPSVTLGAVPSANALLFGLNLGAGADLLLSDRIYFGTRLTFHEMFGDVRLANSVNVGGSLISFIVHVGYSF